MTQIVLDAVSKSFGTSIAVDGVSLALPSGSFAALLGPSGCGKTTLLRLIAGFGRPNSGTILFDHAPMASRDTMVPPEQRGLGMVFQSYALWPHMDVAQNVAYPLMGRRLGRAEIERRVAEALSWVSLTGYGDRNVDALSGGQRQRVALARCLVTGTRIILLDEPLANLDVHLRAAMLDLFTDLHARTGATIVFVTHDQSEALALADRIVVLDRGRVQQMGTPQDIYTEPANAMVAGFVGRGTLVRADLDGSVARIAGTPIAVRGVGNGTGLVLIRPQAVQLAGQGLATTVIGTRYTGATYETRLALATGDILLADLAVCVEPGVEVTVAITDAWKVPG